MGFSIQYMTSKTCLMSPPCPTAPKCGFIKGNEKIMALLEKVKPEIFAMRETMITVS